MKIRSISFALAALVSVSALGASCGGNSSSPSSPSTPSAPATPGADGLVTVFIDGGSFSPNPLTVAVGQSVNWKNDDSIEHTATFNNGMYDSGNIPAFSAHDNSLQVNAKGTFTYFCRIHQGATGTIVVQ
jgi:plastocyanin